MYIYDSDVVGEQFENSNRLCKGRRIKRNSIMKYC